MDNVRFLYFRPTGYGQGYAQGADGRYQIRADVLEIFHGHLRIVISLRHEVIAR